MTAETPASDVGAKITQEGIERLRQRIGIVRAEGTVNPHNRRAHPDTMRHFANGYGDDNPLFCDEDYGKRTRWGGTISPPLYVETMGVSDPSVPPLSEEKRKIFRGDPLAGIGAYWSGTDWEFWRPVQEGDIIYRQSFIADVLEKRSEFGGGHSVHLKHRTIHLNQRREPVCAATRTMIHAERESAASAGKYSNKERHIYTEDEGREIDETYAREVRRGPNPRFWEDVNEGDTIPKIVRGPLLITDIISMHIGWGWGGYRVAALRLGYLNRQRIPKFYVKNEFGYPDVAQRMHWTEDWARAVGVPYSYDYGFMRDNWLVNLVTDWMGDDGWLWKFSDQIRRFNFVGDVQWIEGKVTAKYETEWGSKAVELEIWGTNQDGEITCPGKATVLLPSREVGLPVVPEAPVEIKQATHRHMSGAQQNG